MAEANEEFSDDEVLISVSNTDVSILKPSVCESNGKCISEPSSEYDYGVTSAIRKNKIKRNNE